ncbi:MAG TPA: hypothetical protein VI874_04090, partial [Candidatus Norongarragalinales archaeon]|nr:hypothetical protein [Candidatus Norongarragalinales archaeon]
ERLPVPAFGSPFLSTVLIEINNPEKVSYRRLNFTQRIPFIEYRGPRCEDYPEIVFIPCPDQIQRGSAVVTWLFEDVKPGQKTTVQIKVPGKLDPKLVEKISTPKIIAQSAKASGPTPFAAPRRPSPGGFDWTLSALGGLILAIGAGAYWFTKRH